MNQLGGSAPTGRDRVGAVVRAVLRTVLRAPADPLRSRSFPRTGSNGPEVEL
ncbi:hypothetical protein KGQ20_21755 [Catenulispora sp. NF23]|uniref:Uncharacterized protein n=1 Tax=Catenulispora pinistramenti TaxID=2705254 RepID=A0ABS5L0Z6_9ACTN|nr:hypothetical protein [Catenulispora pinistramenti]MBS2535394.1 hypothetical protein [Catenulispora pinistramenti]MBS2551920.1 hypothetical protein [Catenulispora pinistramenti]